MILSPPQIFALAVHVGFPRDVAVTMTAIALRESAGDPSVHNATAATGDNSYGLWQINMRDPLVAADVRTRVLQAPSGAADPSKDGDLLDPTTNARAAFLLWAGKNRNLDIAWYITRPGYREKYEVHLPEAQRAAIGLPVPIIT